MTMDEEITEPESDLTEYQRGQQDALEQFAAWIDPEGKTGLEAAIRSTCAKYAHQLRAHLRNTYRREEPMNYPTPYGKSEDLALENERLAQALQRERKAHEALKRSLASGEASDGFHTHQELYEARMLYHAHAVATWQEAGVSVLKSWRHHDSTPCFGGGWFVVWANLPGGQTTQHYKAEHWGLFDCREVWRIPVPFDGHTTQDTHQRLRDALGIEEA